MLAMMSNHQYANDIGTWTAEEDGVWKPMHKAAPHSAFNLSMLFWIDADAVDGRINLDPQGIAKPRPERVVATCG